MRLPDPVPSLGIQLGDIGHDLHISRGALGVSADPNVAPVLHDSDQLGRVAAANADSASYDTDLDIQPASYLAHGKVWPAPISPVKASGHARLTGLSFCPPLRGPTADGEGPPPALLPSCGDLARQAASMMWQGLARLKHNAFAPPAADVKAANQGALRSLVSRQIPASLQTWDWYQEEVLHSQERGVGLDRRSVFGVRLLHPLCGLAMVWSTAMLLFDLVFTAFWVPVNVAFCLDEYGALAAACTRTDLAGGIIYLANLLFGLQVGVTLTFGYQARVVMDGRYAARLYASTVGFWLDVLAVVPFVYLVVVLSLGSSVTRHQTVSIISLMRLVRLSRVASIIKQLYVSSSDGEFHSSWVADHFAVTPVYMVLLSYLTAVLVNLYSCILLLIAYYEQRDGRPSWMDSVSWQDLPAAQAARKWYNAMYFSITVMTTTGFADFVPKSPAEQVVVTLMMCNGVLIFGALIALIGAALKRSQAQAQGLHDARRKLTHIRKWLQAGEVPDGVQRDVITFFAELGARHGEGRTEGDIVFELPAHLRQKVTRHVLVDLLPLCPQLAGLAPEVRELVASHCVPLELPTGHDLFRLGDDVESGAGGLWLLEEGVVCAYRYQERMEAPVGPTGRGLPCLLGEGAVLADIIPACSGRMWTLRTERPCRVWQLRGPALRAVLQIYPNLAVHLMTHVKERIMAWLGGLGVESEDDGWCEVVQLLKRSFIMGPLRDRIQDCYLALQLANVQDGTLPQLLAAWLAMSVAREMTLKDEEDAGDDRVSLYSIAGAMALAQARASASKGGAGGQGGIITPAATPERPGSPVAGGNSGPNSAIVAGLAAAAASGIIVGTAASGGAGGAAASSVLLGEQLSDGGVDGLRRSAGGGARRTMPSPSPLVQRSGLWGGNPLYGGGSVHSPLMAPSSAGPPGMPGRGPPGYTVVEEGVAPSLPPAVEQALRNLRSSRTSRPGGLLSDGGSLRGGQRSFRRACSAGGTAFHSSLPSPDGSLGGGSVRNGSEGGAVAAATAGDRASAPAGRGLTAALIAARESATQGAAASAAAGAGAAALPAALAAAESGQLVPEARERLSTPFTAAAAAMASAAVGADAVASGDAAPHADPARAMPTAAPSNNRDSLHQLMIAELSTAIHTTSLAATAGGRAPKRAASCRTIMMADSARGGGGGGDPRGVGGTATTTTAHHSASFQRHLSGAPRGGLADTGLPARSLPGEAARPRGPAARPWPPVVAPVVPLPALGGPWRRLTSDTGVAPPRALEVTDPAAPPGSRTSRNTPGRLGPPETHAAGGATTAAAGTAPTPPAVALTRQVSNGHSTFIHKIFLAAGVQLLSNRPSYGAVPEPTAVPPAPLAPTAAAAGTNAADSAQQAPRILGPACNTCGCATCAFCSRPIVPQGAVAAMRPMTLQRSLSGRPSSSAAAAAAAAAASSSAEPARRPPSGGAAPSLMGPGPVSGGGATTTAEFDEEGRLAWGDLPPGLPLEADIVRRLRGTGSSFKRRGTGGLHGGRTRPRQLQPPVAAPPELPLALSAGRAATEGQYPGSILVGSAKVGGRSGRAKLTPGAALAAAAAAVSEAPESAEEAGECFSAPQVLQGTMRFI